jgi:hypothetical protein
LCPLIVILPSATVFDRLSNQQWFPFGDTDEITGIPVICEYTPVPVGICIFRRIRFLTRFAVTSTLFLRVAFAVIFSTPELSRAAKRRRLE